VQRKGRQARIRPHGFGDRTGKVIGMQLQKREIGKDANAVDTARQLVIVEIQLCQGRQAQELACE
jgi:hypothetical protein